MRAGIVEALAVLIPETFSVELMDVARVDADDEPAGPASLRVMTWLEATLASVAARDDAAVTERTAELLGEISARSGHFFEEAIDVLLTVSSRPSHPLNAEFLHRRLMRMSMPSRDAGWGIVTYGGFADRGPLDRLIRWAADGPYPGYSPRVVELAALPLVWSLSSPNRYLRDYVTKALGAVLAGRFALVESLLDRFAAVNDPYVLQRLGAIAHAVVLVSGHTDPPKALSLARRLESIARDPQTLPDVLLRDSARGALEWCFAQGLVDATEHDRSQPPYGSDPPGRPSTRRALEKRWGRFGKSDTDGDFSSIFFSVFHMGDFGRYVIESDVGRFSRVPLSKPFPRRQWRKPKPSRRALREVLETFSDAQAELWQAEDWTALAESMPRHQLARFIDVVDPPKRLVQRDYPDEEARRWVFERVVELGWTPELFERFDTGHRAGDHGRSAHKAERFGKKYQWIALHELLARVADNFHLARSWDDEPRDYKGPWHYLGRDIDPTLPPPKRLVDDDGVEYTAPTYPDSTEEWWRPTNGPRFSGEDPPAEAGWAEDASDMPATKDLIARTDVQGDRWVVLQAYFDWDEQLLEDQLRDERPRRDMWTHIYGWLVRKPDAPRLMRFLETTTLMGRWMPEGSDITDAAYLPEMPWALAAREYPRDWEEISPRYSDRDAPGIEVYPAWTDYFWESNIRDCSIEHGVSARLPAGKLFVSGELRWVPGTRTWADGSGTVVAEYFGSEHAGSALLVRESWLKRVLKDNGWSLVLGRLGEKQLFEGGLSPSLLGGWTEVDGAAALHNGRWQIAADRSNLRQPVR